MASNEIREIYKKIPGSKCKAGCHKCCTNTIQFSPSEFADMGSYTNNGVCSHFVNGKCDIYGVRPFVCRIYGTSELFKCEDCIPDRYLTADETSRLVHLYREQWESEEKNAKD